MQMGAMMVIVLIIQGVAPKNKSSGDPGLSIIRNINNVFMALVTRTPILK